MTKISSVYLKHILNSIQQILLYTEGMTEEDFLHNQLIKDAVVRNFEIIGEATKNLTKDFRDNHPELEWKKMAGMRDKLIHGYIEVDYGIVWATVVDLLPDLKREIEKIIEEENAD